MNSSDPNFGQATEDLKRGGWIVMFLGSVGMLARMMLTDKHYTLITWFKRAVAGAFVGLIMYFSLYGVEMNPLYKSVLMCSCGAIAPELIQLLKNIIKKESVHEKKKKRNKSL
jgi:hypothetical protein